MSIDLFITGHSYQNNKIFAGIIESEESNEKFEFSSYSRQFQENPQLNPLNDFIQKSISNCIEKASGILPPGVRFITKDFVVYERRPEYVNIFLIPKLLSDISDTDMSYNFRIPLPWQLYIIQYTSIVNSEGNIDYYPSNVKLHFMKESLHSLDQEMMLAPLPNFYTNGVLCRPMFASMEETERYSKDISGVIQAAYDWIWNCGTNMDLTESCAQVFIQLHSINAEETIFEKDLDLRQFKVPFGSYYINSDLVVQLFSMWEKYSLEEIVQKVWPYNSLEMNFSRDRTRILRSKVFLEYLEYMGEQPMYELHYDEDENYEYQCDENEDCDCRIPINSVSWNSFNAFLGSPNERFLTFEESFNKFVEAYHPDPYSFNNHFSEYRIKSFISKLENDIILNNM